MDSVVPQGYKQTKVGVIPEDWDVVKLNKILKVSQGLQIVISNRFIEPANDRVFYITLPYIEGKKTEYIENPKQSVLCNKHDLLVVRTGSGVGKIIKGVESAFHNNFFKIKGFDNLNIDFIYYFLTASRTKYLMKTYASNGTIPDLPHGDFYSLDCKLPPLKEQEKIANILTTWDDAISKQDELIKAKEELKKGLMQKLLSGEVRFDGYFDEWNASKLGDIGKTAEDFTNGNSSFITYKNIFNNTQLNTSIFETVQIGTYEKQNKAKYGDIFFTVSSETPEDVGMSSVLLNDINNIYLNSFCFGYRLNDFDILLPEFGKFYFRSFYIRDKIMRLAQGSTRFNLSKIAEVLSNADKEIDLLKDEFQELKEQKKGLMQKLLTGEVRVKV